MKSAGKARSNGLYRHIRTSKEIIRNLLNDYDNSQHKELRSEAEMNTLLLHSEDVNFSLVVWDDEKHTIYIVEYRI